VFLYGKLGRMKINLLWISEEGEGWERQLQ
jgi:hypothetical protein